ncbi:MAG: hypothetical protein AB1629_05160 [Candidatus Omnitrophota bacterium]
MPKKGYKQSLEHIKKAAKSRKGKLAGMNNPIYLVIDGVTRKLIIGLIYRGLSISQISKSVNLSNYIIKRISREEGNDIVDKLLINNRNFISSSKIGSSNPMKKIENILKRREKVNYKLIGQKISESRKELFKEGKLKHWGKIYPLLWRKALIGYRRRMKENNPMHNHDVVKKAIESQRAKGIYEASRERMKSLWKRPNFRKANIERLKNNNPMKKEEVVIKNWKSHQHKPTGIEKNFMKLINNYNLPIKYVGNAAFFIGQKNPDFKVANQNKVIEVTSDAYNRTLSGYGKSIVAYYKNRGYDCLVIWGSCRRYKDELKKENLIETLSRISNFVNDGNEV